MRVQTSLVVDAAPTSVYEVYASYSAWPTLFPTIAGVRLRCWESQHRLLLEVQHTEGTVLNELVLHPKRRLELREWKRRYDATFDTYFDPDPRGSVVTVIGEIRLKGWFWLLAPLLIGYAHHQVRRLQLRPVKIEAERRACSQCQS